MLIILNFVFRKICHAWILMKTVFYLELHRLYFSCFWCADVVQHCKKKEKKSLIPYMSPAPINPRFNKNTFLFVWFVSATVSSHLRWSVSLQQYLQLFHLSKWLKTSSSFVLLGNKHLITLTNCVIFFLQSFQPSRTSVRDSYAE